MVLAPSLIRSCLEVTNGDSPGERHFGREVPGRRLYEWADRGQSTRLYVRSDSK